MVKLCEQTAMVQSTAIVYNNLAGINAPATRASTPANEINALVAVLAKSKQTPAVVTATE